MVMPAGFGIAFLNIKKMLPENFCNDRYGSDSENVNSQQQDKIYDIGHEFGYRLSDFFYSMPYFLKHASRA